MCKAPNWKVLFLNRATSHADWYQLQSQHYLLVQQLISAEIWRHGGSLLILSTAFTKLRDTVLQPSVDLCLSDYYLTQEQSRKSYTIRKHTWQNYAYTSQKSRLITLLTHFKWCKEKSPAPGTRRNELQTNPCRHTQCKIICILHSFIKPVYYRAQSVPWVLLLCNNTAILRQTDGM